MGPQPNRYLPLFASKDRGLLYPVNSRAIAVRQGETVDIVCTGRDNTLVGLRQASVTATCQRQGSLDVAANFVFNCTKKISDVVSETGESCGSRGNSKIIQIGWDLPGQGFSRQVEVCFNSRNLSTAYSRHIVKGSGMRYRDRNVSWLPRPQFKLDSFFSHLSPSMSTVYTNQNETMAALLGSSKIAKAYIGGWGSESYLARGHLSPDGDFILQTWQDATYHYINAVPQWQAFNNGNWKDLEGFIRTKSTTPTPRDLVIYTGTHGVLRLPDINNNLVSIFLLHGQNQEGVPVPEYMWKVVVDNQSNEAVAFVLLNHPSNTDRPIAEPPLLCPDVCDRITWVPWRDRNNKNKGKIYCCTVASLRRKIPAIPNHPNVKLME
ncbi:hypothetical protein J437_LFUL012612 [Ladona fulva]|uniref:DNA/RNA non-specific endonuclease domain-containing protein n=1 Tax=Ladona fulva TaxID=123851 RepID=A0A8K0KCW3_LADFU|nr:hypothetical protein J437_LFUL012612 [Ladona fulva]